ncbi:Hypothetical protein BFF96_1791 [Corynebacterium pseudotuberculosis]|nr:Hypothetical protein BFF96_1791 [Corynebacterium pseudotuberculosis]
MLGSSPPPPRKKFTLKLILAWIAVALSGFVLLGAIFAPNSIKDALGTAIVAISIGLPGVWYLIHSRRKSHGAPPLKHHWGKIATTSIVLFFVGGSIIPTQAKQEPALPSPSTSTTAPTTKTTTSSTRSTTSSTSSVSTASSTSTEPSSTTTKEAALPAPASEIVDERPIGFAGVPDRQPPPHQLQLLYSSLSHLHRHLSTTRQHSKTTYTQGLSVMAGVASVRGASP